MRIWTILHENFLFVLILAVLSFGLISAYLTTKSAEHKAKMEVNRYSDILSSAIRQDLAKKNLKIIPRYFSDIPPSLGISNISIYSPSGKEIVSRSLLGLEPKTFLERISWLVYGDKKTVVNTPIRFIPSDIDHGDLENFNHIPPIGFLVIDVSIFKYLTGRVYEALIYILFSFSTAILICFYHAFSSRMFSRFSMDLFKYSKRESEDLDSIRDPYKGTHLIGLFDSFIESVNRSRRESYGEILSLSNDLQMAKNHINQNDIEIKNLKGNLRLKNELSTSISHDLRSPINVVKNTATLFLKESGPGHHLTKKQVSYINRIIRSTDEMIVLTSNIMNSSMHEDDSSRKTTIDVIDYFSRRVSDAKLNIFDENLNIQFTPACSIWNSIIVNESQMTRIVDNLIRNAIKFTKSGVIDISADSFRTDDCDYLKVTVSDTGIGIREEHLGYVFDEAVQIDKDECNNGIGYGLYVCKSLVEKMNGDIWVDSKHGEGSAFTFTIPVIILSKISPIQKNIQDKLMVADLSLQFFQPRPDNFISIENTLHVIGVDYPVVSSVNDLSDSDIIIGFNLSKITTEERLNLSYRCSSLVSIEASNSDYIDSEGINYMIDSSHSVYNIMNEVIALNDRIKIKNLISPFGNPNISSDKEVAVRPNASLDLMSNSMDGLLIGYRILVIDDHPDSCAVIRDILVSDDAEVDMSNSISDVKIMISSRPYDVIITDFSLSGGTAIDVSECVQRSNLNTNTPIICCSGNVGLLKDSETRGLFSNTLIKPVQANQLSSLVLRQKIRSKSITLV